LLLASGVEELGQHPRQSLFMTDLIGHKQSQIDYFVFVEGDRKACVYFWGESNSFLLLCQLHQSLWRRALVGK
jgi:hypothetical protein